MQHQPHQYNLPEDEARPQRGSGLSLPARIALLAGALVTGYMLWRLGGGFPPQSWKLFFAAFTGRGTPPAHLDMVIIQSVILLSAWLLLLLVAIQIVRPGRPRPPRTDEESEALTAQQAPDLSQRQQWPLPTQEAQLPAQAAPSTPQASTLDAQLPAPTSAPASSFGSIPFERSQPLPAATQAEVPPPRQQEDGEQEAAPVTRAVAEQEASHAGVVVREGERAQSRADAQTGRVALTESPSSPAQAQLSENAPSALEQLAGKMAPPRLATIFSNSSRGPATLSTLRMAMTELFPQAMEEWFDLVGWTTGHPGRARARSTLEDILLVTTGTRTKRTPPVPFAIFVLADGIAARAPSQTTSRIAARATLEAALSILWRAERLDQEAIKQLLTESVQYGNTVLYQWNEQHEAGQIATLTLVLILGAVAYIANVGDNRAYFYRQDEGLVQITYDHSNIEPQLEQQQKTPEEVFSQPKETQVYRVLGTQASVNVDAFALALHAGDLLILCSDGLWKSVRKAPFQQIVEQLVRPPIATPQLVCPALLQAALAGGGGDHISVLAVQVQPRTPVQGTTSREEKETRA